LGRHLGDRSQVRQGRGPHSGRRQSLGHRGRPGEQVMRGARRAGVALVATLAAAGLTHAAGDGAAPNEAGARSAHDGIWKAVVPPKDMHGEFDSNDPIGVASGERIAADCSINWVDPDERKLYCFSSATSLVFFLEGPHAWIARARQEWRHLSG